MTMRHTASVESDTLRGAAMVEDIGNAISTSRRVRAEDFHAPWLQGRSREMGFASSKLNTSHRPLMHRKVWEYCTIAQIFMEQIVPHGPGAAALGFGCGNEPLPAWMMNHSTPYEIIATDGPPYPAWTSTGQHAGETLRTVDMRYLASDLLGGCFDFTWSCSSMEHIGGIEAGLTFFCEQMRALRKGGIAAHTTELNTGSVVGGWPGYERVLDNTLNAANLCLFRGTDLLELGRRLALQGDRLWALDLSPGTLPEDLYIDSEPYDPSAVSHLNISICGGQWQTTSVLLVAERGGAA